MKSSRLTAKPKKTTKNQNRDHHKNQYYLNLSNEEYLLRSLKLLGVREAQYYKQTKSTLEGQIFPNSMTNPSASKQFFFITFVCLKNLLSEDQIGNLSMWYPPRTVNQQLQFKKVMFKLIQEMENCGKLPKNMVISKATIMGDTNSTSLIQFLRFLSQMALRNQYLQKYSKQERLIQLGLGGQKKKDNDINKFYTFPFVPSKTATEPPNQINLQELKKLYRYYLDMYMKKIVTLKTTASQTSLNAYHQKVMSELMEQKHVSQTLNTKIPKKMLSQNRAFDRRRLIDRNEQIWSQLNKIDCYHTEKAQVPVLKLEGEIDRLLNRWQPIKNMGKVYELNHHLQEIQKIKTEAKKQLEGYGKIKKQIINQISFKK